MAKTDATEPAAAAEDDAAEGPPDLETARLVLRRLELDDAPFVLQLLNEPSWIRYIGDKGVRTLDGARQYLRDGPLAMYARHGLGLMLVVRRDGSVPIGIAGLIKRETLGDVDIGFALLPQYWGQGYAFEAASACLDYGRKVLNLARIVAIVAPGNARSTGLLSRLGLSFERTIDIAGEAIALYA